MSIKRKIERFRRLKAELQKLENEIVSEGFARMHKPNETPLMRPRIERVMAIYGG